MRDLKNTSFADRASASQDAKKALLAKFKPKPTVRDEGFEERKAAREAELQQLRAERDEQRRIKREAAAAAAAVREEEEALMRDARELALKAAQKAARDARYAARKQRRK